MKMIMRGILPALMLAGMMLATPAMAQVKIGTIDLRKVFDNYWKRNQADVAIKKRRTDLEKDLKGFQEDFQKLKEDYEKLLTSANDQSVTPEERDKRKGAAEKKLLEVKSSENSMNTFVENAREQIDQQMKRMRDNILQDIRTAINAKAKSAGYALVVDTAAETVNQTPMVLYSNGENDLTDSVLAQLNLSAPPSSTSDATPGASDSKKQQ